MEAEAKNGARHTYTPSPTSLDCPVPTQCRVACCPTLAFRTAIIGQYEEAKEEEEGAERAVSDESGKIRLQSAASSIPDEKKKGENSGESDVTLMLGCTTSSAIHIRSMLVTYNILCMYTYMRRTTTAQHQIPMCASRWLRDVCGRVARDIYMYAVYCVNDQKHFIHCQLQLPTGSSVIQWHSNAKRGFLFPPSFILLFFLLFPLLNPVAVIP